MSENGFYVATRKVNPILAELFEFLNKTYGSNVLKKPRDFTHIDDVAVMVQLERLRDDLAANLITREDFVNEVYKLLEKHINISPEMYQILNKLHIALSGQPLIPPKSLRAYPPQIFHPVEVRRIDMKQHTSVERGDVPSTQSEAVTVSTHLFAGRERRCPVCGDELYFLQYIRKRYCFNCKRYFD